MPILAPCAVQATGGAVGDFFYADAVEFEGDGAVFHDEAGDAYVAAGLYGVEGGMLVAQLEEGFEIAGLLAYVNELEARVVLQLRLHLCAVGAGGHYVNCNHGFYCFRVEHLWIALAFGRRE